MTLAPPPADPEALRSFPAFELPAGTPLARIHRRDHGPLWFRHEGEGRFDLPPPRGTLYAAAAPLGSYLEVFRTCAWCRARRSTSAASRRWRRAVRLADCTSPRARAFGLTGALHTTQVWAAAFAEARLDGVHYLVRHDPAQRLVCYALFGAAGDAPATAGDWEVASTTAIPGALLREVEDRFGLSALPTDLLRGPAPPLTGSDTLPP